MYVLETAQTLMITNDCFNKYVKHFGDLETLDAIQNEWLTVPVFTAVGAWLDISLHSFAALMSELTCSELCGAVLLRVPSLHPLEQDIHRRVCMRGTPFSVSPISLFSWVLSMELNR